ncbi:MAG TPA: urease accessory protein UreH [Thermoanaerobaculia bacterium]|jgi:ABC-type nickel/cobalt efflux system permease component RcnA|nr:urease accessory protein UreH [Thermoanaerobaculia bacterium]
MDGLIWTAGGIGFVFGIRHALDPDHVVAVSTIASEQRSMIRSSMVGAFWGLGHALSLMAASGALLALKLKVPDSIARSLEGGVAIMLVILGVVAIRRGLKEWTIHAHRHSHDGHEHVHLHQHHAREKHSDHTHRHILGFGLRPFTIGVAHGLAGSAGLAIIAVGATSSAAAGLLYIAMLGLGSAAGMMVLTALMSLPLLLFATRFGAFRGGIQLAAGLGSIAFGCWWFWLGAVA